MPSVSPFVSWLPNVSTDARTRSAGPNTPIDRSSRWMPVAVIGPAGASLADRRQLSAGSERNLSWLKLASTCSSVPSSPACAMRNTSLIGGSKRFSWPTASLTPLRLHSPIARSTAARDSDSGFSQNTCFSFAAACTICSVCWVCGVHRITASTARLSSAASKLFSTRNPSTCTGCTSTPISRQNFLWPFSRAAMVRPHQPRPITATPSGGISVGRSIRLLDDARPLAGFRGDELREGRRRAGHHLDAAVVQARDHILRLHGLQHRRQQPVDDLLRRAGRDEHALPRAAGEVGIARLGQRRHVGRGAQP